MNNWIPHCILIFLLVLTACQETDNPTKNQQSGTYELYEAVDIRISGRTGETIQTGDFFSDTTLVWSGDRSVGDGAGFGDFRVSLPVTIDVTDCRDDTLNVEDIFGDNHFTWQNLELLDAAARRVGGTFEVDMPVVIRVTDSERILVDLEDIFGDNSFTWTVGQASGTDTTLQVGQLSGGVGGPFRIVMSVEVEIVDSEDIEIDVEDILSDNEFNWYGGVESAAAFVGGAFDIEVPLTFRVERSDRVRINLEDTAGDMLLDWTAGTSEGLGGPMRFDVPTSFVVADSRDVNIDFEDQAGDNILNWVLQEEGDIRPELNSSVTASATTEFRVTDGSRGVKINSEDFFSDNAFMWQGPLAQDARAGLDGAVSVSAPTTFRVAVSQGVNIDAEDVYGDNIFAWFPPSVDQASSLPASVYEVVGEVERQVAGDSVTVEFANLNQGNQYLWGPKPE